MEKLYDFVLEAAEEREKLYFKASKKCMCIDRGLYIPKGQTVDFLTYFNSISVSKWKKYTTLKKLYIKGFVIGKVDLKIIRLTSDAILIVDSIFVSGKFEHELDISCKLNHILGLYVYSIDDSILCEAAYYGVFLSSRTLNISVGICTYKREKYVENTIEKLLDFSQKYKWLRILVIDNGSTLKKVDSEFLRIIHNKNLGGSGGFTRALIENVKLEENDYIILMDDDIKLDTSIILRTYTLLSFLKEEYRDSFLAGSMLSIENPYIQYEKIGYRTIFKGYSYGRNINLADSRSLLKNELENLDDNQFAAWWFCCIPLHRVTEIGYPLPVFIKGDDIEYSLRNNRSIMSMNGIGVWHESFEQKQSLLTHYFADRNMLILNLFLKKSTHAGFLFSMILRITKRLITFDAKELLYLNEALADFQQGFKKITKDDQISKVQSLNSKEVRVMNEIKKLLINIIKISSKYTKFQKLYIQFKDNELKDNMFWQQYLNLNRRE